MRKFLAKRSFIYICACAAFCTAAFALQPTVRAGSISLGASVKPNTPAIVQTDSATTNASINRGAALVKFGKTTVPAVTPTTNNNTGSGTGSGTSSASNETLAELQRQIAELKSAQTNLEQAQTDLEHSQVTTDTLADVIAEQVKTLDLTTTNTDLKNALLDIQSQSSDLQTSLDSVQQQTERLGDSLNTSIDSRLQYRGLLDNSNNLTFATKNDIAPESLATKIAANPVATATLSDKITPKSSDIQKIIKADLIEREILDNTGNLNVEKKGEVQVTETTVTDAINNSTTFKNLVSQAATEKGFLTNESDAIQNLATKDSVTADAIATKIANSATATQTLSGKIGPDENSVKNLIVTDLKKRGIVSNDNNETLQLLKTDDLDTKLSEKNVITTGNMNTKLTGFAKTSDLDKLATKSEFSALESKAVTAENKNTMLSDFVKTTDVTPEIIATQIINNPTATQTLSGKIGPDENSVKNLIVTDLKKRGIVSNDNNETLQLLKTDDIDSTLAAKKVITETNIENKLPDSVVTTGNMDTKLSKFAKVSALDTLATKSELNTVKGGVNVTGSILNQISTDENLQGLLKGESYIPQLADDGTLTWKNSKTNETDTSLGSKNIKGAPGAAGTNGKTYIPNVDENGNLTWTYTTDGSAPDVVSRNIKGAPGTTYKPSYNATTGELSWKIGDTNIDSGIASMKIKGEKGDAGTGISYQGEVETYSEINGKDKVQGNAWYNKADGLLYICTTPSGGGTCLYPANGAGATFRGQDGISYIPQLSEEGVLTWKNSKTNQIDTSLGSKNIKGAPGANGAKGEDGISYIPQLTDEGVLTWKNSKTNETDTSLGSKNIKGAPGAAGTNGKTYVPNVDENGNLTWTYTTDGSAPDVVSRNIKGAPGANGAKGEDGISYIPQLSEEGVLTWKNSKTNQIDTSLGSKNIKGADGVTFTPNITDGFLSFTRSDTGASTNAIKIKGEKGDAGTGISYQGEVNAYSEINSKDKIQGHAWYNKADGLLYICTTASGASMCSYPANGAGATFRGQDGANGKTYVPNVDANGNLTWSYNTDGSTPDITSRNIKGAAGENGISYIPQLTDEGVLTWKNSKTNYDAGFAAVNIKGAKGEDGISYIPQLTDEGVLTWKNSKTNQIDTSLGSKNIKGAPGAKGEDGISYMPQLTDEGVLTWKNSKTNQIDTSLGSKNIKGVPGAAGTDGKTYQPSIDSNGNLSWVVLADGTAPSVSAVNIRGPQGLQGDAGTNGKTYVPNVDASGNLTWSYNTDGSTPDITSRNIKGEDGISYIPQLANDGTLTWKNSKTNSDAGFAAVNIKGATGAKGEDGISYIPQLTDEGVLTWKNSKTNETESTLGSKNIKGAPGAAGADGKTYQPSVDSNGNLSWTVLEDGTSPSIEAVNIRGPQGIQGNAGADGKTYQPSVDSNGNLSWTVLNNGTAPSISSVNIRGPQGLQGTAGTDGKTFRPSIDANGNITFAESSDTTPATLSVVDAIKAKVTGTASTGNAYAQASSLENLIKAIAADVAKDVSLQVSEHVSKQVSAQVSDRVAKRRINEISDSLITPTKLTNFITNGIETNDSGVVSLKTTGGGTCSATPVFGKEGNTGSSTCGSGGTSLAVNLSTSEALFDDVPASNTDGITATLTGLNLSIPSYFTTANCNQNEYVDTDTNTCKTCPTGSSSNGGTVTSCTCSQNYYKSGSTCLPCGSGATSGGGNTEACSCTTSYLQWTGGSTGGSCTQNRTTCLSAQNTYWNTSTNACVTLPSGSSRTSDGNSFTCNTNYYYTGTGCKPCGSGAYSDGGSIQNCTCKSGTWQSTSNSGQCVIEQICNGTKIDNECIQNAEQCTAYGNKVGKTYSWINNACIEGGKCTDGKYFNIRNKECLACPTDQGAKLDDKGNCICQNQNHVLNQFQGKCMDCGAAGASYQEGQCTCPNGTSLDYETWQCKENSSGVTAST